MKAKYLLIAVVGINLLACLSAVFGDGGMFYRRGPSYKYADVFQPTQKVYIRWDGSQERLLVQTKYQGPAEEMVWIVPVPAQPTVEKGDSKVFEDLSIRTSTPDISVTQYASLLLFPGIGSTASAGGASRSTADPVEWRRQIGEYDVVLLRPVGEENVILWLNSNDFAVPDKAVPILQDYVRDSWWMVAAKIHPDALTDITRDKLAQGLLHPLEMTFESPTCLYPLRLTSMAAGPVEELIYIEAPTHCEPVTFADPNWQIDVFGGPLRLVPDAYRLPDFETTMKIVEGEAITVPKKHLTKLRRVFQPQEMTQDLLFGKMDYAKLAARGEPLRIAQMATQYGRHRDPNGIPHILSSLPPEVLELLGPQATIVLDWRRLDELLQKARSAIWALGEIAIEHEIGEAAKEVLLQCIQHEDERVRLDACIALTKLGDERLGPIFVERFAQMLHESSVPSPSYSPWYSYWDIPVFQAEMNLITDWVLRFGTAQQKDTIVEGVQGLIAHSLTGFHGNSCAPEQSFLPAFCGTEWLVWRAACTQDLRLLGALEDARSRLGGTPPLAIDFLLRAEAACGSTGAKNTVVRDILAQEQAILPLGQATPTDEIVTLNCESGYAGKSLRARILERRGIPYELYPMPREVSDATIRSAIATAKCSQWYALYLLARIKKPQIVDKERLLATWNGKDGPTSMIIVDVLYVWGDGQTLVELYGQTQSPEATSEIAWALAELGIVQATAIVEEQLRYSWNPQWLALPWAFPRLLQKKETLRDPGEVAAIRTAEAVWRYFHLEFTVQSNDLLMLSVLRPGVLDEERLATLKRLATDRDIHPGMRFDLIGSDYAMTDWGKPLLKVAAAQVLEAYPEALTVPVIASQMSDEFVVDICAESLSDESLRSLLLRLLASGDGYYYLVIEGLLREVWPQRYVQTDGQSILLRAPGELGTSIDYYCAHCYSRSYPRLLETVLAQVIRNPSLPAGYRAFLLVYWPGAYGSFSKEFLEDLLKEDMPDFIREALQERLLEWG